MILLSRPGRDWLYRQGPNPQMARAGHLVRSLLILGCMRVSYLRALLLISAGLVGCHSDNEVSCPAALQPCPATLPAAGTPCTPRGSAALCEYGDDPWQNCNTFAYCDSAGAWYTVAPSEPDCPTTLPSGCPASFAGAAGGPCGSTLSCRYPEGSCSCSAAGLTCTAPAAAGCPATRPRVGSPCSAPCTTWGSGFCDGYSMKCVCGTWQPIQCTE